MTKDEQLREAVETLKTMESEIGYGVFDGHARKLSLNIAIEYLKQYLSLADGMPKVLKDEDIEIEAPVNDGKYWKITIHGAVVALIPSKELAVELVKKCFSVNQARQECIMAMVKMMPSVTEIQDFLVDCSHLGSCIYDKDCHENKDMAEAFYNLITSKIGGQG